MKSGFSFNGIHCNQQRCSYIPAPEQKLIFPEIAMTQEEVSGRDGGYYHSSKYKTLEFNLSCYFEDITLKEIYGIAAWLSKDNVGKLIFDDRPALYYIVRPTGKFAPAIYSTRHSWSNQMTYSGTFTAAFSAACPHAFMEHTSYDGHDEYNEATYSGILSADQMPPPPTPADTEFLVYNCGSHPCEAVITLSGSAPNGVTLTNLTNGTTCTITQLPENAVVKVDGNLGLTTVITDAGEELAFELHDDGYLVLEPYRHLYMAIGYSQAGSNIITLSGLEANRSMIGKYIYVNSAWHKIMDTLDDDKIVIAANLAETKSDGVMIATINEIAITGDDYSLNTIVIDYTPKVL